MKPIKNYEQYMITEDGKVFNTATNKYLKGSIGEHGYQYFRLSKDGKKKMLYGHRLVAEAFIPNPDNLPVVNHIDGNKLNNTVSNLEWTTYSGNTQHWKDTTDVKRRVTEYYTEDLPGEEWKEFGNYYVSSFGRVRHKTKGNLLKPSLACGYYKVRLSKDGIVQDYMIHKLVYQLYHEDYNPDLIIDHIDGNKLNNAVSNLRQVTAYENAIAALYETKTNKSAKHVEQYDVNGNFIASYPSTKEASRQLGLDSSSISKVCRGVQHTCGGFIFKYKE